jgi:glycosyltransferase involved in cell wall biosynthesis
MRIAMIGTRGVPARYGGFETAVEEIGRRLVEQGHEVTVYCRGRDEGRRTYEGMRLVHLPSVRLKAAETLTHTALSVGHALLSPRRHDVAFVFNAANAVFLPVQRLRRVPTAVHVDGLEWQRSKWGRGGRHYYRMAESLAVRWADALIADARGIAEYYDDEFGVPTELITYGAPIQVDAPADLLGSVAAESRRYHLVVARFEPENHVLEIVEGYRRSAASQPLLVVGSAPYADEYTSRIEEAAAGDPRIRLLGGVWDQRLLDQLYAHALTYLHGHSVGGTNPSLLRAMGAGTAVVAYDVVFNREVLGDDGRFFAGPGDIAAALLSAEAAPDDAVATGARLRRRATQHYDWDAVAADYEKLAEGLLAGRSTRGVSSGRRASSGPAR